MMWRKLLPNLLTLAALGCAMLSILKAVEGEFVAAAQFIMLCLVFDGLDGNIARWCRGATKFGAELDTFVDIIGYGVAPALLAHQLVMKDHGVWGLLYVCFAPMSGALRLARFRVVDPHRGQKGYLGLPITVNAGWVAMMVFATQTGLLREDLFTLAGGPFAAMVWTVSTAMLFLQVSTLRYSKPTKAPLFFFAGIAMVLMLFLKEEIALVSALSMCAYGVFYAFISPFLPRHAELVDRAAESGELESAEDPVRYRSS
ncbi:MAG: CDP-alcohol phosphatidyltransferase family protein [Kiritimatiellae bacterium]|nr:CDP-alcohol phosphatidyltransferase family protein [Kiritimatiellia bacterium]MDW8458163.1 CDP-alcohol phosphatidyltransferase family protein [Verrucomicrobiota bacterium]